MTDESPETDSDAATESEVGSANEGVRILGADEVRPRVRRPPSIDERGAPPRRVPGADAGRPSPNLAAPLAAVRGSGPIWAGEGPDDDAEVRVRPGPSGAGSEDSGDDTGSWSSFASSGPRWRDHPGDWDDADVEGALGVNDDARIGALDPDRAEKAASFTFDDEELNEAASPAARRASRRSPVGRGGGSVASGPQRLRGESPRVRPPRADVPAINSKAGRDLPTAIGTGVALGAFVLLALVVGKGKGGLVIALLALMAAGFEMFTALRQRAFQPAIPVGLVAIAGLSGAAYWRGPDGMTSMLGLSVLVTMLWYLFGVTRDRPAVNIAVTWFVVLYVGLLGAFAALLLSLPDGRWVFLAPVIGTVASDTFGYLFGRTLGRTKLAPEVSPNKTWEGTIGGFLGCLFVCGVIFGVKGVGPWNGKEGWLLGIVVGVAAPLGDLCESLVKRDLGIKDASNFLPGHGGVLDRIDGLLFAIPATYFLIRIINIF